MPKIKYTATFVPNVVRDGDKVRIKGILMDNPKEFSFNFVNEHCKEPAYITYHFKLSLEHNTLIQNYKDNGEWIDHLEEAYDGHDGPTFEFEFAFNDEYINVYRIYHNTPNHIAMYKPALDISDIKALQVWGDVAKVTAITFRYPG